LKKARFKRVRADEDGAGHHRQYAATFARGLRPVLCSMLALHLCCFAAFGLDLAPEPTLTTSRPGELWLFLPVGYLFTVAIETPVLLVGLSKKLSFKQRFFAGLWLTACTYPIVVLVLPILFANSAREVYLLVAEMFAPVAECALFWLAFRHHPDGGRKATVRNSAVIIVANLLSFACGEVLNAHRWFGLF
jgi:hypothetical protein